MLFRSTVTVTGLAIGTLSFKLAIPAGATVGVTALNVRFGEGLSASAVNTAITLNVPSFGVGNTDAAAALWGDYLS